MTMTMDHIWRQWQTRSWMYHPVWSIIGQQGTVSLHRLWRMIRVSWSWFPARENMLRSHNKKLFMITVRFWFATILMKLLTWQNYHNHMVKITSVYHSLSKLTDVAEETKSNIFSVVLWDNSNIGSLVKNENWTIDKTRLN